MKIRFAIWLLMPYYNYWNTGDRSAYLWYAKELLGCSCKLVFVSLVQIYNKVKTGDQLKVQHVVSVLEKQYPYVEVNSILGIDSAYDQNRKVRINETAFFHFFLLQHHF